ncbi:MAG: hypothetical protein H5T91_05685 [Synergistetes bacterium]|nr:hypothetical protein [Synergistota bacterium]MDK2870912.1 hypothetical protein [bacterium]
MRRTFAFLIVTLTLMVTISPVWGQSKGPVTVEVEGYGAIIGGDKARALEEAKRDAFRNAIEKGLGVLIQGITEMENFQVIRDRVMAQSKGLITDYKILSKREEDGMIKIKMKATVALTKLNDVLGPVVIDTLGNPVLMVCIYEDIDGKTPFLAVSESTILSVFQNAGYHIVDPGQIDANRKREALEAAITGDTSKLIELARRHDADVIITGKAIAVPYTSQVVSGQRLYGVQAQLSVKAIITQTGKILGVAIPSVRKVGLSVDDAAMKALKEAASQSARKLVYEVAYAMLGQTGRGIAGRTIQVRVEGVSFSQARRIKKEVEKFKGVVGVYQRSFTNGNLVMDVNIEGNAEDLAIRLEQLGLDIVDFTANRIVCKPRVGGGGI